MSTLGNYRIGDKAESGEIKLIHGQSADALVFTDIEGRINWETREDPLPPRHAAVLAQFEDLHSLTDMIPNTTQKVAMKNVLARALFRALCETDEKLALEHLTASQEDIRKRILVRARILYAAAGFGVAVGFVALVVVLGPVAAIAQGWSELLLSAGAGAVGAWVSIIQRAWQLTLESFEPPHYLAFQGAARAHPRRRVWSVHHDRCGRRCDSQCLGSHPIGARHRSLCRRSK